jgi:hypothetical protein
VNLRLLGDFAEAYQLDRKVKERREAELGPVAPETLLSLTNLALDHYGLGSYAEALTAVQGIALERQRLPRNHGEVLLGIRVEAMALRKCGRHTDAVARSLESFINCQRYFGTDHERTLAAATTHANCLRVVGQLEDAYGVASDAVEGYRRLVGASHPMTLAAETNLAIILRGLGEHRHAQRIDESTLAGLRRLVGREHPFTLCAAANLANDRYYRGDLEGSSSLALGALAAWRNTWGDDHPYVLACELNASRDLSALGDDTAAERITTAIAALGDALGPEHPLVQDARQGERMEFDLEPPPT